MAYLSIPRGAVPRPVAVDAVAGNSIFPIGPLVPMGNTWEIGDSITWGKGPPIPGGCGYRDPLYVSLSGASMGATFVGTLTGGEDVATCPVSGVALASDGHTGYTCADVTTNIATWYGSISRPRVAMLNIGTNDLVAIATSVPGYSLAQTITDFDATLTALVTLNPNMYVFVSNMQPMPNLTVIPEFSPFNTHIASRVATYSSSGTNMYLVDMFTAMNGIAEPNPGADFNSGGVHPNASGYTKMAARWYSTIRTAAGL